MVDADVTLQDESDTEAWAPMGRGRMFALAGLWLGGLAAAAMVLGTGPGGSAATITPGYDSLAPAGDAATTARVLASELDVTFGAWTVDPAVDHTGVAHGTLALAATSRLGEAKSFKLELDVLDADGQAVFVDSLTVRHLGGGRTAKGTLTVSLTPASADALAAHVATYRPVVAGAVSY